MKQAKDSIKCVRCKHQEIPDGDNWCYMFKEPPENLPCAQHDKYAELRKATGKLIQKNPMILTAMLIDTVLDMEVK